MASKPQPVPRPRNADAATLGMPSSTPAAQGRPIALPATTDGMRQGERESLGEAPSGE
jgi:hypothetical protein